MRITRRMKHRVLAATIVAGAIGLTAAGATAFTNSTTFSNSNTTVGYGSETVSGAVVTSISYGLSADGSTINSVTFIAQGNTSGSSAKVGFSTISTSGTAQPTTDCGTGVYNGSTETTYICNNDSAGIDQAVADVEATNIVVS
jgi:hypothetical protein